eukprot:1171746-Rhodomonas_salina.1
MLLIRSLPRCQPPCTSHACLPAPSSTLALAVCTFHLFPVTCSPAPSIFSRADRSVAHERLRPWLCAVFASVYALLGCLRNPASVCSTWGRKGKRRMRARQHTARAISTPSARNERAMLPFMDVVLPFLVHRLWAIRLNLAI